MTQATGTARNPADGRRRLRYLVVAVSAVAAAVGVGLVFGLRGGESASSQAVVATLRVPGLPNAISAGPDALWVSLNFGPGQSAARIVRVDLASGRIRTSVEVSGVASGVSVRTGDTLWVGHNADWFDTKPGELTGVDWQTGKVVHRIPFDRPLFGMAFGDGALWVVVGRAPARLVRIDPVTGTTVGSAIDLARHRAISLAFGDGALWATGFEDGTLSRIDPRSGRVDTVRVGDGPVGLAVAAGSVWVANRQSGTVSRIDARTVRPVGDPIHVGGLPTWVAAVAGSVWVSDQEGGTLTRIDARTGRKVGPPVRIAPANPANTRALAAAHALAASGTSLWVSSLAQQTVSRIDATG